MPTKIPSTPQGLRQHVESKAPWRRPQWVPNSRLKNTDREGQKLLKARLILSMKPGDRVVADKEGVKLIGGTEFAKLQAASYAKRSLRLVFCPFVMIGRARTMLHDAKHGSEERKEGVQDQMALQLASSVFVNPKDAKRAADTASAVADAAEVLDFDACDAVATTNGISLGASAITAKGSVFEKTGFKMQPVSYKDLRHTVLKSVGRSFGNDAYKSVKRRNLQDLLVPPYADRRAMAARAVADRPTLGYQIEVDHKPGDEPKRDPGFLNFIIQKTTDQCQTYKQLEKRLQQLDPITLRAQAAEAAAKAKAATAKAKSLRQKQADKGGWRYEKLAKGAERAERKWRQALGRAQEADKELKALAEEYAASLAGPSAPPELNRQAVVEEAQPPSDEQLQQDPSAVNPRQSVASEQPEIETKGAARKYFFPTLKEGLQALDDHFREHLDAGVSKQQLNKIWALRGQAIRADETGTGGDPLALIESAYDLALQVTTNALMKTPLFSSVSDAMEAIIHRLESNPNIPESDMQQVNEAIDKAIQAETTGEGDDPLVLIEAAYHLADQISANTRAPAPNSASNDSLGK